MNAQTTPTYGRFSFGKKTASANTAIALPIWPYMGTGSPGPGVQGIQQGRPRGVIQVTSLIYNIGTTAHVMTVMRPLNYTRFAADAAASQAVVTIDADPGVYAISSTGGYQYGFSNGVTTPRTSANAIASGDYCIYQAADGTWVMDTAAGSYSSGSLTMTTNLPTGGVKKGGLFYFFGISTDSDPATGQAHQAFDIEAAASGTTHRSYQDVGGLWCALHAGDPMILYSANATAAGIFEVVSGYYARD